MKTFFLLVIQAAVLVNSVGYADSFVEFKSGKSYLCTETPEQTSTSSCYCEVNASSSSTSGYVDLVKVTGTRTETIEQFGYGSPFGGQTEQKALSICQVAARSDARCR